MFMIAEHDCILQLNHLVFDEITFNRINFKRNSELKIEVGFNFEERQNGEFVAGIRIIGTKEDEYTFVVRASGYFYLKGSIEDRRTIIQQNATAIIFPYVRSQISLLTAQPEVDPVVLPPMNIAQMVEETMKGAKQ